MSSKKEFTEDYAKFVQVLREADAQAKNLEQTALRLCKLAWQSHRIAENRCNRVLSQREETRDDNIDKEVKQIVESFGPGFVLTYGEVRGYMFHIVLPTRKYNTWGGEETGWGIPEY